MSFDYARAQATAQRLIERFGQLGKLRKLTAGQPPVDADVTLAVLKYEKKDIDGTRIMVSDRLIYVATQNVDTIKPGNVLLDKAMLPYQVMTAEPLNPAGIVVYYEVQGRGPR